MRKKPVLTPPMKQPSTAGKIASKISANTEKAKQSLDWETAKKPANEVPDNADFV